MVASLMECRRGAVARMRRLHKDVTSSCRSEGWNWHTVEMPRHTWGIQEHRRGNDGKNEVSRVEGPDDHDGGQEHGGSRITDGWRRGASRR